MTYLTAPRRNRVMTAKAAAAGAVFGLAGYVVALGTGLIFVAAHGYHVAIGDATLVRYGFGHILAAALLAAVGAVLGSLIRSQLAAVIGVLVWSVVIESIIGGLFSPVQPDLPFTAATTLSGTALGGAAFGPAHDLTTTVAPLPFAAAAGLLAGLTVLIAAVAARTTVPRDVS